MVVVSRCAWSRKLPPFLGLIGGFVDFGPKWWTFTHKFHGDEYRLLYCGLTSCVSWEIPVVSCRNNWTIIMHVYVLHMIACGRYWPRFGPFSSFFLETDVVGLEIISSRPEMWPKTRWGNETRWEYWDQSETRHSEKISIQPERPSRFHGGFWLVNDLTM